MAQPTILIITQPNPQHLPNVHPHQSWVNGFDILNVPVPALEDQARHIRGRTLAAVLLNGIDEATLREHSAWQAIENASVTLQAPIVALNRATD